MLGLLLAVTIVVLMVRSLTRSLRVLRTSALDVAQRRLPQAVESMRSGAAPDVKVEPVPLHTRDEVGQVARAFDTVHGQALKLAADQAALQSNVSSMFVNLSRRSQALVERQLQLIEQLESNEQDPDQLSNLFQLDHLATRMRRNSENLLVLAGTDLAKRNVAPVPLVDVLRAAVSEIEQYQRIVVQAPPQATVVGRATSDVIHLLAELLDNATNFSPPDSQVVMSSMRAQDGSIVVEIADSGVGMADHELSDANRRLATPSAVDVSASRRMGLFVVGRLGARHGIAVHLGGAPMGGPGGGLTASVTLPGPPRDRQRRRQAEPSPALRPAAFGAASRPERGPAAAGGPAEPAGAARHAGGASRRPAVDRPAGLNGLPTRTPGSSLHAQSRLRGRSAATDGRDAADPPTTEQPVPGFRRRPGAAPEARPTSEPARTTTGPRAGRRPGAARRPDRRRRADRGRPDHRRLGATNRPTTATARDAGARDRRRSRAPSTDDRHRAPRGAARRPGTSRTCSALGRRRSRGALGGDAGERCARRRAPRGRRRGRRLGPGPAAAAAPADPGPGAGSTDATEPDAPEPAWTSRPWLSHRRPRTVPRRAAPTARTADDREPGGGGGRGRGAGGRARPRRRGQPGTAGRSTDDSAGDTAERPAAAADGDRAPGRDVRPRPSPRPVAPTGPNGTYRDLAVPGGAVRAAARPGRTNGGQNGAGVPPVARPPGRASQDRAAADRTAHHTAARGRGVRDRQRPTPSRAPDPADALFGPAPVPAGDSLFAAACRRSRRLEGASRLAAPARRGPARSRSTSPRPRRSSPRSRRPGSPSDRPVPVDWELGERPDDDLVPASAPAPAAPPARSARAGLLDGPDLPVPAPTTDPNGQAFATVADEGWRAASGAAAERPDELTAAGLPKRRPRARLVPGSAGSAVLAAPASPTRSAESVRGRLASYQQGVRQGREIRLRRDPGRTGSQPVTPGDDTAASGSGGHDEESR